MARRRANRQAAPFSRGLPNEHPKRPGRKSGAAYGRAAHRRPPPRVDVTHDAPLPAQCPDCGGSVCAPPRRLAVPRRPARAAPRRPRVSRRGRPVPAVSPPRPGPPSAANLRRARRRGRAARAAGRRARRDPQQTAAASPSAGSGTCCATASASPSRAAAWSMRSTAPRARRSRPTRRCAPTVRGSPVVTPDETGWKVGGHSTTGSGPSRRGTPRPTRSKTGAALRKRPGCSAPTTPACCSATAGPRIANSSHAAHQTCLAHLLRRCRTMRLDHPSSSLCPPGAGAAAGRPRDPRSPPRRHRLGPRPRGRARPLRQPPRTGCSRRRPSRLADARRFAAHLRTEFDGRLPLPLRPHARRHQLARRARPAACRDHPQDVRRRQSHRCAARRPSRSSPRSSAPPSSAASTPRTVLVTRAAGADARRPRRLSISSATLTR